MRPQDRWARWLLHDRFGGDETALERTLASLRPIRDRVLDGAMLRESDVLLDVGAGDGLIGFAALERLGPDGRVVFADISDDLVATCRHLAERADVLDRCTFTPTAAEHLDAVADASVDVVTTRSVLLYVDDKAAAFSAFVRVLRPGGRISLFEPINRDMRRLNQGCLLGYDVCAVQELADKVRAVYERSTPTLSAMLDFDGGDLAQLAVAAGFQAVTASVEIRFEAASWLGPTTLERVRAVRPNPQAPTFGDAVADALDDAERARLEAHLRPQVEAGTGGSFFVGCFLTGRLPG